MPRVYDDEKQTTNTLASDSDLRQITGINEAEEKAIDERASTGSDSEASSASDLSKAEESASKDKEKTSDTVGKGYTDKSPEDDSSGLKPAPKNTVGFAARTTKVLFGSRRRKIFTAIGISAGVIGSTAGIMITLSPLKIVHITQNLQNQYFGVGEQAMSKSTENLLSHYLIKQVMPGMIDGLCSTTRVDKTCAVAAKGTGPVAQVYNAWRDARFETKLANKYGIEIMKRGSGTNPTFYLKTPSMDGDGVSLGRYNSIVNYDDGLWANIDGKNRNEIRRDVKRAFESESFWKRGYYRWKVGAFLEKKYGIARCTFACDGRDNIRDRWGKTVTERVNAGRGLLTHRVLGFAEESTSIIYECAFSKFDCADYDNTDNDGSRTTKYERDLRARIVQLRAADIDVDDLIKQSDEIRRKGFMNRLIEKIMGETVAKIAGKAVPIVGWVDLAVLVNEGMKNAGPAIRYLSYAHTAGIMVEAFTSYRSAADELKAGNADAAIYGSLVQTLSSMGGYSAEQSPLYQQIMPSGSSYTALAPNQKVYAEGVSPVLEEVCSEAPKPEDIICSNESLKAGPDTFTARAVSLIETGYKNSPSNNFIVNGFSEGWSAVSDAIFNKFGALIGSVTSFFGLDEAMKWVADVIGLDSLMTAIGGFISTQLINNPIASPAHSINNFTLAAGGADVLANEHSRDGLAAEAVSYSAAAKIRNEYLAEERETFQQQSLYARMFDTESTYSAVSQLALSTPFMSTDSLQQFASSVVLNPLNTIGRLFSSFSGMGRSAAVNTQETDPFGVQQYAYPPNHPVFTTDPEVYWAENDCGNPDQVKNWVDEYSVVDPETGQTVLTQANGCKLLMGTITASGGLFDSSLIPVSETGNPAAPSVGSLRVATFNLLGNQYTEPGGKKASWPSGASRMVKAVDVMNSNGFEVVGLQELEPEQRTKFLSLTTGEWEMYPANERYKNYASSNSIVWKSSVFELVDSGLRENLNYLNGNQLDIPWVLLRHLETGEEIYVVNTHDPVDTENAKWRISNAKKHKADGLARIAEGKKVIITGDFNSNTVVRPDYDGAMKRSNLSYCLITDGEKLQNAYDTAKNEKGYCPTTKNTTIDHIYHSSANLDATSWSELTNLESQKITDHTVVFADISILGSTTGGASSGNASKEGWQWPISGAVASKVTHGWGDTYTRDGKTYRHKAIDIGGSNGGSQGAVVYAAHDGVVKESYNDSGCGYFYLIKATGTSYWMTYQHMANLTTNKKVGDSVTAGEPIGKVGPFCGEGYHLHFGVELQESMSFYATPWTPATTINPLDVLP